MMTPEEALFQSPSEDSLLSDIVALTGPVDTLGKDMLQSPSEDSHLSDILQDSGAQLRAGHAVPIPFRGFPSF